MPDTNVNTLADWKLELERERFGVTRRQVEPKVEVREVIRWIERPCTRKHVTTKAQEERDQLYFNAGRFAAGATDKVAENAYEALLADLG